MKRSREEVLAYVIEVLRSLEEDSETSHEISEDTYILGDRSWRSIDVIFLANTVQEHFDQKFPFTDLFNEIGQREVKDITVGEWVDFLYKNLGQGAVATHNEAKA
jgi:hypothetical protein